MPFDKQVTIFQHRLLHYRTELFQRMKNMAEDRSIELNLVHGQATDFEKQKQDEGNIAWAVKVCNVFLRIGGRDILWQPFPLDTLWRSDLLIIMQENRILSNYVLMVLSKLGIGPKVAYWGHGINFQSKAQEGLREKWKKWLITKVDWWFAYTDLTSGIVKEAGFPVGKITCLNNAIDNKGFNSDLLTITEEQLDKVRGDLGIEDNAFVGISCGSLYPDKRIDFLVESAKIIRQSIRNFHLIIIGNGPDAAKANSAAEQYKWIHYLGVQKGIEKAKYFKLADVILNPGLVGLHIVDAFCAGLPFISVANQKHSPEVVYLVNGQNGFLLDDDIEVYAAKVIQLKNDVMMYNTLCNNAKACGEQYTLKNMAGNFIAGIEKCLKINNKVTNYK